MTSIDLNEFPNVNLAVQCSWAPICMEPLLHSGERLTIGVVAANMDSFFVARANRLERLNCLFDGPAKAIVFAAEAALDAFEMLLAEEGLQALKKPQWLFESISLGQIQTVRGASVRDVATTRLAFSSSLHQPPTSAQATDFTLAGVADLQIGRPFEEIQPVRDRLPKLVYDYVVGKRPGLSKAFRQGNTESAPRRRRSHEISIDFYGSGIVANLGTLAAGGIGTSVERIKRKMWDLKVERDLHKSPLITLKHEMLVQRPANDDPQLSQRQLDNLQEAITDLEKQADLEEIRFRPLTTVGDIGEHLLSVEAA